MELGSIIEDGSITERLYGSLGNEKFIDEEMGDFLLRTMIENVLKTDNVTQDELYSKYHIEEEDVEKYGLEHLVAGGYNKRSENK